MGAEWADHHCIGDVGRLLGAYMHAMGQLLGAYMHVMGQLLGAYMHAMGQLLGAYILPAVPLVM